MTDFCPNCFAGGFAGSCAACGYLALCKADSHLLLHPGLRLAEDRYVLGRVLGAGGFGVTYLALDTKSGLKVAVKEYLPAMLAVRAADGISVMPASGDGRATFEHGLSVFSREAQTLRNFLGHAGIVQVLDSFLENGTAYFVMEYLDGVNLAGLMQASGGRLPVSHALEILHATALTLSAVHAKEMLHRDISPENILVTRTGQIKLIDFGATRFFVGERSRSLSVILKPGYAPPEQYSSKGNQGPWTDLYALCATFYAIVSGCRPPDAPDRLGGATLEFLEPYGVPNMVAQAVFDGMQVDYRLRPQDMPAFIDRIICINQPLEQPKKQYKGAKGTPYVQSFFGGIRGDRWILPKNIPIIIGRAVEKCNVVLDALNVSRIHCELRYDETAGVFYITDLSTNGTLIESGRLERDMPQALVPGERFYILTWEGAMEVGLC